MEFSLFGKPIVETTAKATVAAVTPAIAAMFADAVTHFSSPDVPNTRNLSFDLPEVDADGNPTPDPETFREMVKTYAASHNVAYGLPKWQGEHMSKERVDKATGKVIAAKLVPDNGKPKHWNVGRNVTFRFSPHKPTTDVDTKTVTVTTAAPKPAAPATR
jgi:hypothetical protein